MQQGYGADNKWVDLVEKGMRVDYLGEDLLVGTYCRGRGQGELG